MDINEKLQHFESTKLIDVVKNYRQYGYGDDIRNAAITILESRGIDLEVLKLSGNLVNTTFDEAKQEFELFEHSSKVAFLLYGMVLIFSILPSVMKGYHTLYTILIVLFWISIIGFIVYLIRSFIYQSRYYVLIGKKESQLNPGLYFTVGMAVYIVMYFMFRKQMRNDMNEIR